MKNRAINISSFLLLFAVNTAYYWEVYLGTVALVFYLVLGILFIALLLVLMPYILKVIKEKFSNKKNIISLCIMAAVLGLVAWKPFGLIDFERLQGKDVLIASQEGVANCTMTYRLKEGGIYTKTDICFGILRYKGKYSIKNDTVYFEKLKLSSDDPKYRYGVIENNTLNIYPEDNVKPYPLSIIKNDLKAK